MQIEFVTEGDGPPALFLPGSYSTPSAWRQVWAHLPAGIQRNAIALPGYGRTEEVRPWGAAHINQMIDLVAEAADRLDGPVHLVGHSFGGLNALATALSGRVDLASLALFEGNPINILRSIGQTALWDDARATSDRFAAAVEAGEPDAPAIIIDYWGGDGAFASFPAPVQDYCRATARTNVLDWDCAWTFAPDLAAAAALDVPVLLVRGAQSNPAIAMIYDRLAQAMTGGVQHPID
ncbi:MAG: alpha/beta fold hydrolase, partial [Paracoccaceae bacterium]|nr:alpha/beta fold hydrolase [Paracoccaceae bacterium]